MDGNENKNNNDEEKFNFDENNEEIEEEEEEEMVDKDKLMEILERYKESILKMIKMQNEGSDGDQNGILEKFGSFVKMVWKENEKGVDDFVDTLKTTSKKIGEKTRNVFEDVISETQDILDDVGCWTSNFLWKSCSCRDEEGATDDPKDPIVLDENGEDSANVDEENDKLPPCLLRLVDSGELVLEPDEDNKKLFIGCESPECKKCLLSLYLQSSNGATSENNQPSDEKAQDNNPPEEIKADTVPVDYQAKPEEANN